MGLYAFDGTWQRDEIDDERDTNVRRLFEAYTEHTLYTPGVGTRWWLPGSIDVTAAIRPSRLDPIKDPYRSCRQTDRRHYTVSDRADCNNPPAGILIETEIDEWPGAGRS